MADYFRLEVSVFRRMGVAYFLFTTPARRWRCDRTSRGLSSFGHIISTFCGKYDFSVCLYYNRPQNPDVPKSNADKCLGLMVDTGGTALMSKTPLGAAIQPVECKVKAIAPAIYLKIPGMPRKVKSDLYRK